jgi:hypothetical protein
MTVFSKEHFLSVTVWSKPEYEEQHTLTVCISLAFAVFFHDFRV